jgi:hypothetical protein
LVDLVEPSPGVAFSSGVASAPALEEAGRAPRFGLRRCGRMLGRLPSTSPSPELGELGSDKRLDMIAQRATQRVPELAKCSVAARTRPKIFSLPLETFGDLVRNTW